MLTYKIHALDRAIAFQIIEQSPEVSKIMKTRVWNEACLVSNGWTIKQSNCPAIDVNNRIIFLRGSDSSKDLRIDRIWDLSSDSYRDSIINQVDSALKEFLVFCQNSMFQTSKPCDFAIFLVEIRG